jgi:broad specificity phosphatase PhoE
MKLLIFFALIACVSCSPSYSYYIVRHAERATQGAGMSSDVPLSETGQQRAQALKYQLQNAKVDEIFSTNTLRTRSTVKPLADTLQKTIQIYGPRPDSAFIANLRSKRKNIVIVGHSNTVDDIANGLAGKTVIPADLPETQYGDLFIVTVRGKKIGFKTSKYGDIRP